MCLKVIVLRISGYTNCTLGFLLGHSKCVMFFNFCVISVDAPPLGPLPYLSVVIKQIDNHRNGEIGG